MGWMIGVALYGLGTLAESVTTPYQSAVQLDIQPGDLAIVVGVGGVGGDGGDQPARPSSRSARAARCRGSEVGVTAGGFGPPESPNEVSIGLRGLCLGAYGRMDIGPIAERHRGSKGRGSGGSSGGRGARSRDLDSDLAHSIAELS